ncbi:MAG: diguanylate cyclase/phosphodiesterase [bacterium]|nr:MAG: diguanylate cyclase/phosphodiesterase [bacterium]KAF0149513.1 MAG: diguanylate cyclase/phosphodiesterase [bacterium]KAF0168739.1 MAG: diguanylate cyclase/phosphodiesterase [bacterium]TXT20431.1 MAG: diguanylate cyclase/phosphodiesterase [bacterium]
MNSAALPSSHSDPSVAPASGERLADRLADFLSRVSPRGAVRFVSHAGAAWLGYDAEHFRRGDDLLSMVAEEDQPALRAVLAQAGKLGRQALNVRLLRADGVSLAVTCRVLHLAGAGERAELLFAAWELGELVRAGETAAPSIAADPVTGLPTRPHLLEQLEELARRPEHAFALLHMDLDGFQKVNDALGHAVGDRLLAEAAGRLVAVLRASDSVIRSGSDEFALILPGAANLDAVLPVARKVLAAMQRPYILGDSRLHLSASIGIALYPEHAADGQQLFRCADIALTAAKHAGRNRWSVYLAEGAAQSSRRVVLEEHMYDAIQNGEFEMHYQPICRAATGEIEAVEALMRWHRPEEGGISPAEFIPLAERNGLIGFLGTWSLRASCHQVARWNAAWGTRLRASVNLSPVQFRQGNIVSRVREVLGESALRADCLSLEITEGTLMHDPGEVEEVLNELRGLGVSISVDDFGTGYSSLAYLKRFPLSCLKIDRSFVRDLETDANDLAIVSAIFGLAKELGLRVVAEGVESERQLAILAGKGCDQVQGYLLGRPVSAAELTHKVESGEWRLAQ